MTRLQSSLNTASSEFRRNEAHNRRIVAEFKQKQEAARHARPERDLDRLARQKKMPPRQRIEKLLQLTARQARQQVSQGSRPEPRRGRVLHPPPEPLLCFV